jgi:hypothetical protein
MSISINQTPASASLAQSPMVFSVLESDAGILASSSMQYVAELTYWTGSILVSGSSDYTLTKYPNTSDYGIFDISKVINSTLTEKLQENSSNAVYYKAEFYPQYIQSGSTQFTTGSHTVSDVFCAVDGYGIFPENITSSLEDKTPFWPLMTDGPATQSAFNTDGTTPAGYGRMGAWKNGINDVYAEALIYSSSTDDNHKVALGTNGYTSALIDDFPIGVNEPDFLVDRVDLEWFTIQASGSAGLIGQPLRFEVKCEQKYPNVRIKWKNRFGQFDYFNFDMVSREAFSTTKRTFQPQVGSWDGSTLGYNSYDSSIENYISDSSQTLQVNTDWVSEDYNDIFKQLLVSDEIYWIYNDDGDVKPLAIKTSNLQFKTGVVDKLIRYTFDFDLGQNYKLIL